MKTFTVLMSLALLSIWGEATAETPRVRANDHSAANRKTIDALVKLVRSDPELNRNLIIGKRHIAASPGVTILVPMKHLSQILSGKELWKLREQEIDLLIEGHQGKVRGRDKLAHLERLTKIAQCNRMALRLFRRLEEYDEKVVIGCEGFAYGDYNVRTSRCIRDNQEMLGRMRRNPSEMDSESRKRFLVFLNLIMATTNYEITNGPLKSFGLEDAEAFQESIAKRRKYGFDSAGYWIYDRRNRGIARSISNAIRDYQARVVVCPIGMNHVDKRFSVSLPEYLKRTDYSRSYIILTPSILAGGSKIAALTSR